MDIENLPSTTFEKSTNKEKYTIKIVILSDIFYAKKTYYLSLNITQSLLTG